jgi:hypothetical protein
MDTKFLMSFTIVEFDDAIVIFFALLRQNLASTKVRVSIDRTNSVLPPLPPDRDPDIDLLQPIPGPKINLSCAGIYLFSTREKSHLKKLVDSSSTGTRAL